MAEAATESSASIDKSETAHPSTTSSLSSTTITSHRSVQVAAVELNEDHIHSLPTFAKSFDEHPSLSSMVVSPFQTAFASYPARVSTSISMDMSGKEFLLTSTRVRGSASAFIGITGSARPWPRWAPMTLDTMDTTLLYELMSAKAAIPPLPPMAHWEMSSSSDGPYHAVAHNVPNPPKALAVTTLNPLSAPVLCDVENVTKNSGPKTLDSATKNTGKVEVAEVDAVLRLGHEIS